jgi:hypothetical protein
MSYSAVNQGFAREIGDAEEVFSKPVVAVELPPGQAGRPDAVIAFAFAANQMVRLFSKVHLVAPDVPLGPNPWGIPTLDLLERPLAQLSEGAVEWTCPRSVDVALGIGAPPTARARHQVTACFNGFEASLDLPLGSGDVPGPFGALLAACYGTAQVFAHAVRLAGGGRPPIAPFRLSLLDYDSRGTNLALPEEIDLGEVHLVGVGAVGSAAVYSLGHLPRLRGTLYPIDNDHVDERNLNRYVLMRRCDVGRMKADVARDALAHTGLAVLPKAATFEAFRKEWLGPIDLLLTPVDSEAGRRKLASHLPRSVLNAATGNSTVTVSRHGFADGKACLSCLYLPRQEDMTTEKRIALDVGLSVREVEELLSTNAPVSAEVTRRIERHRGVPDGSYASHVGKSHIQSLYQQAVCGAAPVTAAGGTIVSPLSFISATAGVMLAAELVKFRSPALMRYALDNYFRVDTLAAPNPAFRQVRAQEPSGRCICHDRDFADVYRSRYA